MSAVKAQAASVTEQRNKILAGVGFAVVMIGILFYELHDPSTPPPAPVAATVTAPAQAPVVLATPPGNVAGPAARTVGSTSAALDPTLHMQAMLVTESVTYTGSGRNIFSGTNEAPPLSGPMVKPLAPGRTTAPPPTTYRGPIGPAALPPIDLKFFGTISSPDGHREAFLLHGDDVSLAANGDIVQRKYRIINIGPNSILVEDLTNNNRQTLPLLVMP